MFENLEEKFLIQYNELEKSADKLATEQVGYEIAALAEVARSTYSMHYHDLHDDLFKYPVHKKLLKVFRKLREQGALVKIDHFAIQQEWRFQFPKEKLSNPAFDGTSSPTVSDQILVICERSQAAQHPKIGELLRERECRRVFIRSLQKAIKAVVNGATIRDVSEDFRKDTLEGVAIAKNGNSTSLDEAAAEYLFDLRSGAIQDCVHSGSQKLDEILGGGYARGSLNIIGARPSVGKSMVTQNLCLNSAFAGNQVMFFTFEMTSKELARRLMSSVSYGKSHAMPYIEAAKLDPLNFDEIDRIEKSFREVANLGFHIYDGPALSASAIGDEVDEYNRLLASQGRALDIVVVDYIGLITSSNRYKGNRNNEVGEISRELLDIARRHDVAVIALSQLNRESEKTGDGMPRLRNLRESGNLEQDAHVAVLLHRPDRHEADKPEMERKVALLHSKEIHLIVDKNRNGPANKTIKLYCDPAYNYVADEAA